MAIDQEALLGKGVQLRRLGNLLPNRPVNDVTCVKRVRPVALRPGLATGLPLSGTLEESDDLMSNEKMSLNIKVTLSRRPSERCVRFPRSQVDFIKATRSMYVWSVALAAERMSDT